MNYKNEEESPDSCLGPCIALIILAIIVVALSACASTGSAVTTVTKAPDGTTTTITAPVLSPAETAFHANCEECLKTNF